MGCRDGSFCQCHTIYNYLAGELSRRIYSWSSRLLLLRREAPPTVVAPFPGRSFGLNRKKGGTLSMSLPLFCFLTAGVVASTLKGQPVPSPAKKKKKKERTATFPYKLKQALSPLCASATAFYYSYRGGNQDS